MKCVSLLDEKPANGWRAQPTETSMDSPTKRTKPIAKYKANLAVQIQPSDAPCQDGGPSFFPKGHKPCPENPGMMACHHFSAKKQGCSKFYFQYTDNWQVDKPYISIGDTLYQA